MRAARRTSIAEWRAATEDDDAPVTAAHVEDDRVVLLHRWPKPDAPSVVLLHGIGMGEEAFGLLRRELSRSFDVVALDLPGFGPSPEPSTSLSMPELADLVATALASLVPSPATILGHSMGAQLAAELAVRHPSLVERLVLVSPTVDPAERTVRRQALRLVQDVVNHPPVVLMIGARLYWKTGARWYFRKLRTMLEHDIRPLLPRIAQPTLVVRGDRDRVCAQDWVEEVATALPEGRLRLIEGAGHEAVFTGAERLARMVEELAR